MIERLTDEALSSLQAHAEAVVGRGQTHTHVPCREILALVAEVRNLRGAGDAGEGLVDGFLQMNRDGQPRGVVLLDAFVAEVRRLRAKDTERNTLLVRMHGALEGVIAWVRRTSPHEPVIAQIELVHRAISAHLVEHKGPTPPE